MPHQAWCVLSAIKRDELMPLRRCRISLFAKKAACSMVNKVLRCAVSLNIQILKRLQILRTKHGLRVSLQKAAWWKRGFRFFCIFPARHAQAAYLMFSLILSHRHGDTAFGLSLGAEAMASKHTLAPRSCCVKSSLSLGRCYTSSRVYQRINAALQP